MPRRKPKQRQRKNARESRGSDNLDDYEVVYDLATHAPVLKKRNASPEAKQRDASPEDFVDPIESLKKRFPRLVKMSECPNAKPLYPDLEIPLAQRLAELESLAPSEQIGVKLREAGLAMEMLLDRIENAEGECAVDDTKNSNQEYERITALQRWLSRETSDLTKRQREMTSLGVELWKAFEDGSDEQMQAKLYMRVLYPYLGKRMRKANALSDELAKKVEQLRPNGDEVTRLRTERDELRKTVSELQKEINFVTDELESETCEKEGCLAAYEDANEALQHSREQVRDLSAEIISLWDEAHQARMKADNEKKKMEEQHASRTAQLDGDSAQLQQKLQQVDAEKQALRESRRAVMESCRRESKFFRDYLDIVKEEQLEFEASKREAKATCAHLQDCLAKADDEKRTMEQTMDQLASDLERAREVLLAENVRLDDELKTERLKGVELAAQVQRLNDLGSAHTGQRVHADKDAIQALKNCVYPTLFAKHEGYRSTAHFLSDLIVDQGLNGEVEARKLGFESFREFLHSEEMATIAFVDNDDNGRPVYRAIPNETNSHLRAKHEKSAESHNEQIKKLRRYLQNEKDKSKALEASMHQTAAAKDREIEHLHAQARCSICMERRCDTTFICVRDDGMHFVCGHLACAECADQWKNVKKECHVCRARIYQCTKLYFSGES